MALSYTAVLRVPLTFVPTGLSIPNFFEFSSGGAGGATISDCLTSIKPGWEAIGGGTFSWVITTDATYTYYTISWTGLTSDPATDPNNGNPVAIVIIDAINGTFATQFLSADLCDAQGNCQPCPPSVNPDDATDCLSCYPLEIEFCDSTFDIEGLEADTEYTIKITDNVSNKTYDYVAVADQYGIIAITTANYPTGVFTPYNSPLSISILDVNGDPVILTYGYVNYSCLELNVTNTTTIT